jgi:hypothetical protein
MFFFLRFKKIDSLQFIETMSGEIEKFRGKLTHLLQFSKEVSPNNEMNFVEIATDILNSFDALCLFDDTKEAHSEPIATRETNVRDQTSSVLVSTDFIFNDGQCFLATDTRQVPLTLLPEAIDVIQNLSRLPKTFNRDYSEEQIGRSTLSKSQRVAIIPGEERPLSPGYFFENLGIYYGTNSFVPVTHLQVGHLSASERFKIPLLRTTSYPWPIIFLVQQFGVETLPGETKTRSQIKPEVLEAALAGLLQIPDTKCINVFPSNDPMTYLIVQDAKIWLPFPDESSRPGDPIAATNRIDQIWRSILATVFRLAYETKLA